MGFSNGHIKIKVAKKDLPMLCACASAVTFLMLTSMFGIASAGSFIPILCAVPLFVFIISKQKGVDIRPEVIMNESPSVIGMMRLMIDRNRSLDSAVREVALNGPRNIARMFSKVVWDVDTKASSDIRDSLNTMLAAFSDKLTAFRRSMYLIISASDSKDANERT
ncbi:MAG: hypothetical protein LBE47_00540, partial [Methanomassiliicoccaceae archaeon]|nr:hypothetical protein [Methanomassiliicoccaceae archaeon]